MYYSGIEPCDVLNGEGFRTVIWVSGCSIGCKGCFNPSTHNPYFGQEYTQETENYILECLSKDYIDGITITGGNPLEDYNLDTVLNLVNKIRLLMPEKTIWLYTGYTLHICKYFDEDIFTFNPNYYHSNPLNGEPLEVDDKSFLIKQDRKRVEIIKSVDVLVDGRYIDSQRNISKKWAGSDNQRVISIPESLKQNKIVLYCD